MHKLIDLEQLSLLYLSGVLPYKISKGALLIIAFNNIDFVFRNYGSAFSALNTGQPFAYFIRPNNYRFKISVKGILVQSRF